MPVDRSKKYDSIVNELRNKISRLKNGDKLPPIRTLMKEFSVSQSPLDNALRIMEREQLIKRVTGSGVFVHKEATKEKKGTIGLVVPDIADRFSTFFIKGAEERLAAAGYRLLICSSHLELAEELALMEDLKEKIDALIIFPYTSHILNSDYVKYFIDLREKQDMPVICVNSNTDGIGTVFLDFNHTETFHEVTSQAIKMWPNHVHLFLSALGTMSGAKRLLGFKAAISNCPSSQNIKKLEMNAALSYEDLTSILGAVFTKYSNRKWVIYNAYPPALPQIIRCLNNHQLQVPDTAKLISIVETDYKDFITKPIIALIKPAQKLGAITAEKVLEILNEPTKKNYHNKIMPLKFEINDVYQNFRL